MRLAGLLLVVGIIGFLWTRRASPVGSSSKLDDELFGTPTARPGLVAPGATPSKSQPQAASSGLRRPIDRTRSVLEQVKQRNGDGEF
jgi:hypothetical protein